MAGGLEPAGKGSLAQWNKSKSHLYSRACHLSSWGWLESGMRCRDMEAVPESIGRYGRKHVQLLAHRGLVYSSPSSRGRGEYRL